MPDLARWGDPRNYLTRWVGRASIIGGYLSECHSVLDIGAGTQSLREYVSGKYIPVDCVNLSKETILLDLDSDWEETCLPDSDGVAMAGVLEHVKDPISVIRKLSPIGKVWAVSYMDSRKHTSHNLIPLKRLEAAFNAAGMRVDKHTNWRHQRVYRLVRI